MTFITAILAELLKDLVPQLLAFVWEKTHEPTTVEDAAPDPARRDRLLAAIRAARGLQPDPRGDGAQH
jgi:hypothetical protein